MKVRNYLPKNLSFDLKKGFFLMAENNGRRGHYSRYSTELLEQQNIKKDDTFVSVQRSEPEEVAKFDAEAGAYTDEVIANKITVVGETSGDPITVKVMQKDLPKLTFLKTRFKFKGLKATYNWKKYEYFYRADSIEVVE